MATQPTKSQGKYSRRDDVFLIVTHRPKDKTFDVVNVVAGYTYKSTSKPQLTIDKNKVIKGLECCYLKASCAKCPYDGYGQCVTSVAADTIALLKEQETVKRGRWVEYPECLKYEEAYLEEHIVCSACGKIFDLTQDSVESFDYCPHCGAKMDGEEEYE